MRTLFLALLLVTCTALRAEDSSQVRPWQEYRTIMWMGESPYKKPEKIGLMFQRLREMGVNTAMLYGDGDVKPLVENQFPYYVENIVNRGLCLKFSSHVADWDKFVTMWAKEGRPESALIRDYCLDDPQWRGWAQGEMQRAARKNREHEPLAYDIRDELSTTLSANPFDYDFSPLSLAGFRKWLREQYGDVAALNAEWQTQFNSWDEVKPFTTDQIKNRMASGEALPQGKPDWQAVARLQFEPQAARQALTRWNFSPWADFRTYMDVSLASALSELRAAAHRVDPHTPVGIEGTQMPSAFGGYDLYRLAGALDWVEPYDIASSREIFGSFMPGKPVVTTVFENDTNHARRRLWHLLLEGDRGCIIWWSEDCIDWNSPEYALTAKAQNLAPVLREMTSPLARLFLGAQRERDPIYLLYSQPSIQVDWLLESTVDGSTWLRRFSSFESAHNRMARVRNAWLKAFQDLGYSPQFVAGAQLEAGALRGASNGVIVLPTALALSAKEGSEIAAFVKGDGRGAVRRVFCDGTPGLFDEHGRLRARSSLDDVFPAQNSGTLARVAGAEAASHASAELGDFGIDRLRGTNRWAEWIRQELLPITPEVSVPLAAHVRVHRFRIGNAQLLALERNVDYQMSEELKQAGGNEPLETPMEIEVNLPRVSHVYNLRSKEYLGFAQKVRVRVEPWAPTLLAVLEQKVPEETLVDRLAEGLEGERRN